MTCQEFRDWLRNGSPPTSAEIGAAWKHQRQCSACRAVTDAIQARNDLAPEMKARAERYAMKAAMDPEAGFDIKEHR